MRLARFDGGRVGVVTGEDIVDVTTVVVGHLRSDGAAAGLIHELIGSGVVLGELLAEESLAELPTRPLADVALDAPLPQPSKIVGAPVNYRSHIAEMALDTTIADWGMFLKAPSSVIGPGEDVCLPYLDQRTDHEAELGVVIGSRARRVRPEEAMAHVYGYTCCLDITVRGREDRSTRKSFDTFTPLGPWIVTADEVPDPHDLDLRLWVNDDLRQRSNTSLLIFDVAWLVAYTSSVMTLEPGDVIATGTPAGVGPLVDGDRIALEIGGIGRLEVGVTARGAVAYDDRPLPPGVTAKASG